MREDGSSSSKREDGSSSSKRDVSDVASIYGLSCVCCFSSQNLTAILAFGVAFISSPCSFTMSSLVDGSIILLAF
jgi:hypothetical protein